MPDKRTIKRARKDKRRGLSSSSQAGEFVRDEIRKIRRGEHGARSTKQAIAIGLSQARRAGVHLRPPAKGKTSERTRKSAVRAYEQGFNTAKKKPSRRRSLAILKALRREGKSAASREALARQARSAAAKRSLASRRAAAKKAVRTKGPVGRSRAAKKAARTRAKT